VASACLANRKPILYPDILRYHRTIYGDDERLKYIIYFLDVRDQRVLEIGPLEGHHSVILEKMGVRENLAIESRADNLRKCQRIKEKYHLDHTQFLQYNLEDLYRREVIPSFSGPFDLVFCQGVLYHLPDPGRGLEWMRSQASTLFLGTYYCEGNPEARYSLFLWWKVLPRARNS
jgi:2-polyprenyl-3-methyl-5-hydroxy-6-metoxy-1,4-benzoquinol methylase